MNEEQEQPQPREFGKKILYTIIVIGIIGAVICVGAYLLLSSPKAEAQVIYYTPSEMDYFINHSCKCIPVIDIRTPEEFATGHINRSTNVDWQNPTFSLKMSAYNKTNPIIVYCKAGTRTDQAIPVLKELGFELIYILKGGIEAWKTAGLPVES